MEVKIIKSSSDSYWYADMIGEVFEVKEEEEGYIYEVYGLVGACPHFIDKVDCEVILEEGLAKSTIGTQQKIEKVCKGLEGFLKEKNKRYGDSALDPQNIFSKLKSDEQIKIRLDDKLSRINNSGEIRKNDLVDITGYLILLMIAKDWTEFDDLLD